MCPKTEKVLVPKGYKNVYDVKRGNDKETLTVLSICSADGRTLIPNVVFVRPNKTVLESMPSTRFSGRSESGWTKTDIFFEYNGMKIYLEENKIVKPVLLFVDGQSHLSMELSQYCHDNGIILDALPPNTIHIMHHADVSL
ncbi:hypothetical protein JTB14_008122 [Gonioctena quinquepunctata]|nr:hypothetical protein JTB14_008122 [Gonioctena quinquepunctata]